AAFAATTRAAPGAAHAEEIIEDIGERRCEVCTKACGARSHPLLERGMPEPVISSTFVAVFQYVVGFVELLEPMLTILVTRIAIRMVLHRELSECRLDLGVFGRANHTEDFVIVAFCHPLAHPKKKASPWELRPMGRSSGRGVCLIIRSGPHR